MYAMILPANEIPSGSLVTKKNGTKEYTLYNQIALHSHHGKKIVCDVEPNVKYLVDGSNNINMIDGNFELRMVFDTIYQLDDFIQDLIVEIEDGRETK